MLCPVRISYVQLNLVTLKSPMLYRNAERFEDGRLDDGVELAARLEHKRRP